MRERDGFTIVGFSRLRVSELMPRAARRWAAEAVGRWAGSEVVEVVRLLTSELATNALQHGGADGWVRVSVLRGAEAVRVEVTDEGGGVPVPRVAEEDDEDGRGLLLLDALARAWGHDAELGGGTTVWFELDAR